MNVGDYTLNNKSVTYPKALIADTVPTLLFIVTGKQLIYVAL